MDPTTTTGSGPVPPPPLEREPTPTSLPAPTPSIPQKRAYEEDHAPSVPSPLNPETKPPAAATPATTKPDEAARSRAPTPAAPVRDKPVRAKKDSLKKREAKGLTGPDSSRATPDPKLKEDEAPLDPRNCSPLRYKLAPPKDTDFEQPKGPVFTPHHEVEGPDKQIIQFCETSDHVYNKKNFHYTHCIADRAFPSMFYYRQTEHEPYGARMSFEDAAAHVLFDRTGHHVTTDKGFRMARANVCVREGRWYWECRATKGIIAPSAGSSAGAKKGEPPSHGHMRVGFARREASLDAPVGFDAYSYGIRDKEGHKVHMSRPKAFFPPGEEVCEGDVLGLEIKLPSEQLQRKVLAGEYNPAVDNPDEQPDPLVPAPNIVRDRIPIRFKSHLYFEKIDYHTTKALEDLMNPSPAVTRSHLLPNPNHPNPALRTLPGSYIKVYKNGVLMGTAFEDLLAFLPPASKPQSQVGAREGLDDGMLGYYPAVSVFRMGSAEVNFGPKFWYPPPGFEGGEEKDVEMTDGDQAGVKVEDEEKKPRSGHDLKELRPVSQRYAEQVVEDVICDVVDEVDFWWQDAGPRNARKGEKVGSVAATPGQAEIKELVQDD